MIEIHVTNHCGDHMKQSDDRIAEMMKLFSEGAADVLGYLWGFSGPLYVYACQLTSVFLTFHHYLFISLTYAAQHMLYS